MGVRIGAAQVAVRDGDLIDNIGRHLAFIQAAAAAGVDVLIFPELSLSGYEFRFATACLLAPEDERVQPIKALATGFGMNVVVGAPVEGKQKPRIGALIFGGDGSTNLYSKEYLHPGEDVAFEPGCGGEMLALGDERVGLAICADTGNPTHPEQAKGRGATIYAAGSLITPEGFEEERIRLSSYAAQHEMVILLANHASPSGGLAAAGRSSIWTCDGNTLVEGSVGVEAIVIGELRPGDHWFGSWQLVERL